MILPALNEEAALPAVLEDIARYLGPDVEVVVVDDGSTDRTAQIADDAGVRLVRHSNNRGKGAAMASGVAAAEGDYLVFMDADATYPAAAIPRLVELLARYDIVRGERPVDSPHIPKLNRFGNRAFNRILASFHNLEGDDIMSGLYGMSREAYDTLRLESAGFDIEVEIGIKARQRGLTLGTFAIEYQPRLGDKKLRPIRDGVNILVRVAGMAILFSPTLTFIVPGVIILALGIFGALALSGGPVFIGSIGLSIHSFVLAALGILGGFQLIVLGVAANLYRIETGVPPRSWLLALAGRRVRLTAAIVGVVVALVGAIRLAVLIVSWIVDGTGDFTETESLVISASLFVFGLQLMSAGLFLSLFEGRLARRYD